MKKNWKEIILYPAIGALVYSGLMLVIDWRRNKLDSFWLYLVCFVLFYFILYPNGDREISVIQGEKED